MTILNIFKRRSKPITVDSTYDEIRMAAATGKITYAYAFGLIQEKNRRAELARNQGSR